MHRLQKADLSCLGHHKSKPGCKLPLRANRAFFPCTETHLPGCALMSCNSHLFPLLARARCVPAQGDKWQADCKPPVLFVVENAGDMPIPPCEERPLFHPAPSFSPAPGWGGAGNIALDKSSSRNMKSLLKVCSRSLRNPFSVTLPISR